MTSAGLLVAALARRGWTLGVAESLTGGLVAAAVVDVPGASRVLRGGVVAYATDVKASLLGVDPGLLARRGAVDPDVAAQMAAGAARVLGADVGVATTGVAGPDPQDGHPPGLVHVAVRTPAAAVVRTLRLQGGREAVRRSTTTAVIELAARAVEGDDVPQAAGTGPSTG
ncbi:CinA family protein [Cellulosimicrobium cellulans]|uniref:CinA family protein n=1 Tax=Cellulosimicrobium cellulans TaxID=1710 RepID=UPI0008494E70|nr:CinA family protein [Cellulosimicrobium cellulans]